MTVVVVHSFSKPLGHVLIGQLDFHIGCARVGELVAAVGVAEVAPHSSEFRRDVIVSVFLRNHLAKKQVIVILQQNITIGQDHETK